LNTRLGVRALGDIIFDSAQDIPRDMRLDPAVATEDSARVGVHGIWYPGTQYESSNDILVFLQRVDGRWQIADIDRSWGRPGDRANSN
jgi:hypothetical protein